MAAQKGNQYWKLRQTPGGKPRTFESPAALRRACINYFEWVEANPIMRRDDVTFQGDAYAHEVPQMRAMTIAGLCLHLGIPQTTWRRWRTDKEEDFLLVMEWAEAIIFEQKFTGAAAGVLKENLIARELGLADKQQKIHAGEIDHKLSPDDATKKYLEALGKNR